MLSCGDGPHDLGMLLCAFPHDEESRTRVILGQCVQDARRVDRVRAVVEGQGHGAPAGGPAVDRPDARRGDQMRAERVGEASHSGNREDERSKGDHRTAGARRPDPARHQRWKMMAAAPNTTAADRNGAANPWTSAIHPPAVGPRAAPKPSSAMIRPRIVPRLCWGTRSSNTAFHAGSTNAYPAASAAVRGARHQTTPQAGTVHSTSGASKTPPPTTRSGPN